MMSKLKTTLFSERGMNATNFVFFLLICILRGNWSIAAALLWGVYLIFAVKLAPTKAGRIVNTLLLIFVAVMLALNAIHRLVV